MFSANVVSSAASDVSRPEQHPGSVQLVLQILSRLCAQPGNATDYPIIR